MDFDGYGELSSDDEDNAICCSHHYSSDSGSDDDGDLNTILQYSANRTRQQGQYCRADPAEEVDPFEEELAGELDQAMLQLRALDGSTGNQSKSFITAAGPCHPSAATTGATAAKDGSEPASSASSSSQAQEDKPKQQYDSIYFDSDEDDGDEGVQNRRAAQSDADLLYDPSLDDLDQQWMDAHRASAHRTGTKRRDRREGSGSQSNKQQKTKAAKNKGLPDSDAVLNCPGCLTMLCADCQRHAIYSTQFRAMFVFSCKVDYTQLLRFPAKLTKKEIWKNKKLERKMRQAMKKKKEQDEEDSKGNVQENDVKTSNVLKEDTSIQKDEIEEATIMECNTSSNSIEHVESGTTVESTNDVVTPEVREPFDDSKITEKLPNGDKKIQEQMKSLPVKKVRFDTDENGGNDESKKKAASEPIGAGGVTLEPAAGGGLLQVQDEELFHPVMCRHCNTKVAVLDKEEVYHFFNVITSY